VPHEKNSPDTAKKAMADYYDDVLGSLLGGPEERETVPNKSVNGSTNRTAEQETAEPSLKQEQKAVSSAPAKELNKASPALKARKEKAEASALKATVFAEPEEKRPLPTLAPPKVKPAVVDPVLAKVEPSVVEPVESPVEVSAPSVEPKVTMSKVTAKAETQQQVVADAPAAVVSTETTDELAIVKPLDWLANGRPAWAQSRFECLLFSVAGLKLAVPLVSLGSIHRIESELTPLVGRADWFIGLYRTGERNINVVDTAKWVMPRQYHEGVIDGYHFVIRLGDTNWGVACDSVAEAIQLEPDQVKWRTERSKRSWLSGTVIEHMCALLDADMLSYLLDNDTRPDGLKKGG